MEEFITRVICFFLQECVLRTRGGFSAEHVKRKGTNMGVHAPSLLILGPIPTVLNIIRESNLSFASVISTTPNSSTNFLGNVLGFLALFKIRYQLPKLSQKFIRYNSL